MMSRRTIMPAAILAMLCCSRALAAGEPLKVYILAGQSNMEGHAKVEAFDYIGDDPNAAPLLKQMRGPDGKPRVCDRVWVSYLTGSPDCGTLGEGFGKLTAGYGSRSNPKEDGGEIGPEKEAMWKRGASNAGYHYLGCAKTLALIGKAFAEAMLKMER